MRASLALVVLCSTLGVAGCGPKEKSRTDDGNKVDPVDSGAGIADGSHVDAHEISDAGRVVFDSRPPPDGNGTSAYGDADVDRDGGGACSSTTCTTPVDD
ncbi:MAG: hypothetical protein HY698_03320, partial [Deltaproteobacteria bacterium]|nr:hypothetical protein [Deltaproteobacteria bacterium]